MAVVESSGVDLGMSLGSSSRNLEAVQSEEPNSPYSHGQPKNNHLAPIGTVDPSSLHNNGAPILRPRDHTSATLVSSNRVEAAPADYRSSSDNLYSEGDSRLSFKRDLRELEDMFSKLNPMAEAFVPSSMAYNELSDCRFSTNDSALQFHIRSGNGNDNIGRRKNNSHGRRMNSRTSRAQREEVIRRTVYVSDIDNQVTEEQLAALFLNCGQVVDCRVCGDPNSVLRFAFVEFTDEEGAQIALSMAGTMLGYYPVKVLPSKTAIAPVNPTFLPTNEDEREMCARTIYCTNIDKKVSQADVKLFFESVCGEVYRIRLLGDYRHSTRVAFVEFVMAESAIAALNCSGVVLGSLPIRVSPSKTPVRPRPPRLPTH